MSKGSRIPICRGGRGWGAQIMHWPLLFVETNIQPKKYSCANQSVPNALQMTVTQYRLKKWGGYSPHLWKSVCMGGGGGTLAPPAPTHNCPWYVTTHMHTSKKGQCQHGLKIMWKHTHTQAVCNWASEGASIHPYSQWSTPGFSGKTLMVSIWFRSRSLHVYRVSLFLNFPH